MKIGHASIDENGKVAGGKAGDQTKKEVCTREWYSKSWKYVIRAKDKKIAGFMAAACEKACENEFIGYDQTQRNTLRTQAQKVNFDLDRINTPCECDCSSLMTVCAECAGIQIPYNGNNAPTTSTMVNAFKSTGFFEILTDPKYLTSAKYLKRGDIMVKPGSHTVMVLEDGDSAEKSTTKKTSTSSLVQKNQYKTGKTYITSANLYIRETAFGEKKKFSCITENAQKHSKFDNYGNAILLSGTEVTCKEIAVLQNSTWMRIPSGWICAINEGKVYIN